MKKQVTKLPKPDNNLTSLTTYFPAPMSTSVNYSQNLDNIQNELSKIINNYVY